MPKADFENPFLKRNANAELEMSIPDPFAVPTRTYTPPIQSRPNVMPGSVRRPEPTPPPRSTPEPYSAAQRRTYQPIPPSVQSSALPIQPPFYLSKVSERMLAEVPVENLQVILDLSKWVGEAFYRKSPSVSDVEVAITFGNLDKVRAVAEGTTKMNFTFAKTNTPIPKAQEQQFWKRIANHILTLSEESAAPEGDGNSEKTQ